MVLRTRWFSLLFFLGAAVLLSACGSPAADDQPRGSSVYDSIPSWAVNIPSEPGMAFYGVGQAPYQSNAMIQNAISAASQSARQQIAETMRTRIQAVVRRYMQSVLTPGGDFDEEAFAQTVSRSVTDQVISGVTIVTTEVVPREEGTGIGSIWALARIGFDGITSSLHEHTRDAVEEVGVRADEAFRELDRLLEAQQLEDDGNRPYEDIKPPTE